MCADFVRVAAIKKLHLAMLSTRFTFSLHILSLSAILTAAKGLAAADRNIGKQGINVTYIFMVKHQEVRWMAGRIAGKCLFTEYDENLPGALSFW